LKRALSAKAVLNISEASMFAKLVLIGLLQVTSYRSVPEQTDNSPMITSIGEHVHMGGIAVSQDLLKSGKLHYHDTVYVQGFGYYQVNDTMNVRIHDAVDIWVETKEEERLVGVQHHNVYLLRRPE